MKTYRNEQLGFEIDIPAQWSFRTSDQIGRFLGKNHSLIFRCRSNEAFSFQISASPLDSTLSQTENDFRQYAQENGYTKLGLGRFKVGDKEHVWARYYVGYGQWAKKYKITLCETDYTITATCLEQKLLLEMEKVWDEVAASFRLLTPAERATDPKREPSKQKSWIADKPVLENGNMESQVTAQNKLDGTEINPNELNEPPNKSSDTLIAQEKSDELGSQPLSNTPSVAETHHSSVNLDQDVRKILASRKEFKKEEYSKQKTLAFSIISYTLIAVIAFLYVHSKTASSVLFSLNGGIGQSLAKPEYNIVTLILIYGIGAFICLLFLLGIALNEQSLNNTSSFFGFLEKTMRSHDEQQKTLGGFLFCDYTRNPKGVLDALHLQFTNLIRALFKIVMVFLSVGLLHPVISIVIAVLFFGPKLILDHPVPIPWQAGTAILWFYLSYRAVVFWLASMKGITRSGDRPVGNQNTFAPSSQQKADEKLRQGNSKVQAALHMFKAASFAESKQGSRVENLGEAIHHFQQALDALSRRDNPIEWASTQNCLGEAYRNLSLFGDRAKNLDQAIFHYLQALEIVTRQSDPDLWAAVHNNLGIAYANGASGDQAENVEKAIQYCQQALEVYTRNSYPDDWAMTQNNLGSAYRKRIRGDRAGNIEQAIHHFQQALEVQVHQTVREQWAGTEYNLSLAYWDRQNGERAQNLEQYITHAHQVLKVFTRETHPKDWAAIHVKLGAVYQIRIQGTHAENLEHSISHIELALTIYSLKSDPKYWAEAQNTLALAFQGRKCGERAENIEKAISLFQQVLQVYTRRDFPVDWAVTQNYMAFSYEDRIRGNRADNIEEAIGYFQQALKVFTRQAHPDEWAQTHTPLASAYEMRKIGKRAENLDQAARHYKQALEVHTRQDYPEQWAMGQIFLGITCMERKRGKPAEYTAQAIKYYQQAQQVFIRDKYPEEWDRIQEGLAAAYTEMNLVGSSPSLSYPQFYNEVTHQQAGQKRTLKLSYSAIPDSPFSTSLWLSYQWNEKLPNDEANRLAQRAIAYISCAIYDAACSAGWSCHASPIPNGRRPAWILDGERSPVSLTLSDIDLSERNCQLTIGAVMMEMGKPPGDRAHWKKLHAAFKNRFSEITV